MRKSELESEIDALRDELKVAHDSLAVVKHELDDEKKAFAKLANEHKSAVKSGGVTTGSLAEWVAYRLENATNDLERAGLVCVRGAVRYLDDCEKRIR